MNNGSWPPPLKDWVQRCLKEAAPASKDKVHGELKKVIFEAYRNKTINSTDWSSIELESLKQQRLRDAAAASSKPAVPLAKGKRKKPDYKSDTKGITTPVTFGLTLGKSAADDEANEKRRKRFAREHEIAARGDAGIVKPMASLALGNGKMRKKYGASVRGVFEEPEPMFDPNVIDWDKQTIVGTSTTLEKRYLRLTSEPDPSTIRPLPVLIQTLELLKKKWRSELNYTYICDQFKSVRQDLTVQRIKNYFTVQVYEIHARIALESKDLGELNQCQSMLRVLYGHGIPGHPEEFLAYRILYMLHTKNKSELNLLLSTLTPEQRAQPAVEHALKVQTALATSNYHAFFVLFTQAPNMGAYMMDHFVERERVAALATMSKAYPTLPVSFIYTELAFDEPAELVELLAKLDADRFVLPSGVKHISRVADSEKVWDCRAAAPNVVAAIGRYRKTDLGGQL